MNMHTFVLHCSIKLFETCPEAQLDSTSLFYSRVEGQHAACSYMKSVGSMMTIDYNLEP